MTERGPGRPPAIDRGLAVRTGLGIAAGHGFAAVSAREITTRLGVSPMAIYRHFSTMEQLRAEVADAALAEVADPDPAEEWGDQLRAVVGDLVEVCRRYKGLESEPVTGEQPRRIADLLVSIVRRAGGDPDDAPWTAQMILTLVVGHLHVHSPTRARSSRRGRSGSPPPSPGVEVGHWARVTATTREDELLEEGIRRILGALE